MTEREQELLDACQWAEGIFRDYAHLHRAKGTASGDAKAQQNESLADILREVIDRPQGKGEPTPA